MDNIPAQIQVKQLLQSRYSSGEKPLSWDDRVEGHDVVLTEDGKRVRLFSNGGQSPPRSGWCIIVTGGNAEQGYRWTLYGIPPSGRIESVPERF